MAEVVKCDFRWKYDRSVRVRTTADAKRADNVLSAKWHKGDVAHFDGWTIAGGILWGTYIGPTTKRRLWAAIMEDGTAYGKVVL